MSVSCTWGTRDRAVRVRIAAHAARLCIQERNASADGLRELSCMSDSFEAGDGALHRNEEMSIHGMPYPKFNFCAKVIDGVAVMRRALHEFPLACIAMQKALAYLVTTTR